MTAARRREKEDHHPLNIVSTAAVQMLKERHVIAKFSGAVHDDKGKLTAIVDRRRHADRRRGVRRRRAGPRRRRRQCRGADAPAKSVMGVQAFIGGVDETAYTGRGWTRTRSRSTRTTVAGGLVGPFREPEVPVGPVVARYLRRPHARSCGGLATRRPREVRLLLSTAAGARASVPSSNMKANGTVTMPQTYVTDVDPLNVSED